MNELRFVVYNIASSKQIYYGGNMVNLQLRDDLKVSKLILGTVNFGTGLSKEQSFEMMDYYFAKGGNTFDTARAYCGWIKGGVFSCGYNRRLEDIAPKHMKYLSVENVIRYGKLLDLCEKKNYDPSSAALQYITDNKLKAAAIIGASKMEHLIESMKAAESRLTEDEIEELV